jgi:hypothetical protein
MIPRQQEQDGLKPEDKVGTKQKDKMGPESQTRQQGMGHTHTKKIVIVPRQEDEMAPRQKGPIQYTNTIGPL